ncbi:NAD-dependent epimerase/dehydratase family protein [Dorea sp. AGR2135]|uniref:NAD-dependent epimerase/dehydratase family protein n=1 Tax=Dorea sp. AGR2135 TaxID=1280669 RepID=UPI0004298C1A|nr:NAD(P)-dependent oxidoreductase [Dorea sp. AGR2135]
MRVLLVGNTGYITKEFVQEAFPESEVFIMGNSLLKTERKKHLIVRPFPEQDEELEDIFHTYDFELMVYFSNYITFHGTMEGEAEKLRKVLSYCKRSKEIHVIYLTGPEAGYAATTGKTLLVRGAENLCCQYGKMYQIPVKIVRIPYLYSGVYKEDYFYKMFAAIRSGEPVEIQESSDQPLQFLNSMDLAELLEKMSDNWDEEYHYLNVPNVFSNTFRELEQKIKEIDASVRIENRGLTPVEKIPPDDKVVRFKYGWFPKISLLEDLPDIYDQYLDAIGEKERRIDRWKIWLDKHRPIVKIVELVVGFFLFEFLNHLAGNQAQFKMIDLRLVFIVLFGSLYGINYGIAAAALETVSLLAAYEREGVGWTTLFYEPSNWIPFIFYFAVGAICGYVRMKNKENIEFVTDENKLIQEKFLFMRDMYQDSIYDKRTYKKQIMGSRDSFGKIFDITRKLDTVLPQELFIETIHVMEDMLENHAVAVYSLGKNSEFGRLEIASKEIRSEFPNSIRISKYQAAISELEDGNVWVNRELLPDYPAYMAGIRKNKELVMIVCIKEVRSDQMTLYYMNLFKILCGLVEVALLRALEYQEAAKNMQYVEGTHILKTSYFMERLETFHAMQDEMVASYILLRLEHPGKSKEEADQILQHLIRANDVWGISEEGELYLILSQTDKESLPIVSGRLKKAGIITYETGIAQIARGGGEV